jgi:hypothetical protein
MTVSIFSFYSTFKSIYLKTSYINTDLRILNEYKDPLSTGSRFYCFERRRRRNLLQVLHIGGVSRIKLFHTTSMDVAKRFQVRERGDARIAPRDTW